MSKRRFTEDSYRKEPWFRALCAAFLSCKTEEEMADFLRDAATLSELQALSERLEVAKELSQGLSYRQIAKNTGASTTTVTRVGWHLENGTGGYRKFLKTHRHHRMKNSKSSELKNTTELSIKLNNESTIIDQNLRSGQSSETQTMSVLQKYLGKK